MSFTHRAVVSLILCFTPGLATLAQGVQATKEPRVKRTLGVKNTFVPTPDQQTALGVLDQLFEAAKSFDDERLRIRSQARVADLLWAYDEPRARLQFEESFRAAMSAKAAAPNGLPGPERPSGLNELQSEVLALVSRRDADLAEKLIKSVAGDSTDKEAGTKGQAGAEQKARRDLYLQAALSIAKSDPGRAAQLAKLGLGGELSPEIIKILFALRSSSPAAADDLFRAALTVARQGGRHAPMNIEVLAAYALPEFATMGVGTAETVTTPQHVSPLVREFLSFTYETFLQLSGVAAQLGLPGANYSPAAPNPTAYLTGQRLLPSFARYMPDKAAAFKQAVDAVGRNVRQANVADAIGKMLQSGGANELLEQAESERNKSMKELLFTRAAMSAVAGGDFERALSIVEKLSDEGRRASLGSVVRLQAATAALKKEEVDSALRYAAGVTDLRQRAYLHGVIARALFDKGEAARASAVLGDAERDIDKAADDAVKANALLIIAEVRTRLDPAQGFEAAGAAVKAFNRADSGEAEGGGRASASAGGSSALSAALNSTYKLDVPNFEPVFLMLGKADFNRAVHLARTLERNERSVSAQLAACQGVLAVRQEKKGQTTLRQ